jgi:hypothetical protein
MTDGDLDYGLADEKMSWMLTGEERWIVASALSRQIGIYEQNSNLPQFNDEDKVNMERLKNMLSMVLDRLQEKPR